MFVDGLFLEIKYTQVGQHPKKKWKRGVEREKKKKEKTLDWRER